MENSDDLNAVVYAAAPDASRLCVTLINRKHGHNGRSAKVVLNSGIENGQARVVYLTVPNVNIAAKTCITLGCAPIQDDAIWNGKRTTLVTQTNGTFDLKLPEGLRRIGDGYRRELSLFR